MREEKNEEFISESRSGTGLENCGRVTGRYLSLVDMNVKDEVYIKLLHYPQKTSIQFLSAQADLKRRECEAAQPSIRSFSKTHQPEKSIFSEGEESKGARRS